MAGDFQDEFKVSIIADATAVDQRIKESTAKLNAFKVKANQSAQIKLRVTIAELESKIAEARKKLSDFKKEGDKNGEIKTRLEISGLQQNKGQASKILKDLQSEVGRTGKSFFSLNTIVTDGLKAFGAFTLIRKTTEALTDAFNAAVSFESAFAGIKKTIEGTPEDFEILETEFRGLAKQIPVTVENLAKIGEIGGQLGVGKDKIIEFTKTIAAIGVSTNLTEEAAATSFAKISNIFQEPIDKVSNLASAVVALGNDSSTTESQIVDFATNIAAAGKLAGLTQADVAGISAAFSSVGIDAEAGGTAVSKTLQTISDAVNKGGQDLTNFGAVSGLTGQQFADLWKSDPSKAFEAFVIGLGKSGQKGSEILEELVGGDARLKRAFLSLASSGDLLTKSIQLSNDAFEKNTALTEEAKKRYDTTESKLQLLAGRFNDIKITIGNFLKEAALPVLEFLVSFAEALAGKDNELSDLANGFKALISPIILLFKGLGLLTEGLGKVAKFIYDFKKSLDDGSQSSNLLKTSLKLLFDAALLLASPLIGISNVILGLIDNAYALDNATKGLKQTLSEEFKGGALDAVKNKFEGILDKAAETKKTLDSLSGLRSTGLGTVQAPNQASGVTVNQAFDEASVRAKENLDGLKESTIGLLQATGLSASETANFTSKLDIFNGATSLGADSQKLLNEKLEERGPVLAKMTSDFSKSVNSQVASGRTLKEAIADVTAANESEYEKNGQNAEQMTKIIKDLYIANVADSKGLGEAAAIAYGENYNSSETRSALKASGIAISDQILLQQLATAIASGNNGEAAGLLLALGIGSKENLDEVANSGENLNAAVQNTFEKSKPSISATGKSSGNALIQSIIAGISAKVPTLADLLNRIIKSLGGLGSFINVLAPIANEIPAVKLVIGVLGNLQDRSTRLQENLRDLQEAGKDAGNEIKNLGGPSGKALDEAKKKADDAEKSVDDFTKAVEDNNKASEKLRDNIVKFYKDIVDSIDKAKEKQADLRKELEEFTAEENKDFAENTGKRDLELEKEKEQLEAEKKALQQDLLDSQSEFSSQESEGITAEDIADQKKKEAEIVSKIAEKDQEINDVLNERQQIQDFLNGLVADGTDASQKVLAEFEEARRRATLTEFEQNRLELEDKIKQKEAEVQAEIDKQQKIIDIQKRFLDLQNATDFANIQKKNDLIKLATEGQLLTDEERNAELERLGFEGLTKDQELELLKQVEQANALAVEQQQIEEQQALILETKQTYFDLAEDYHGQSVDRMKEKTTELIDLIKQAQQEQIRLNSLRGASSAAANSTSNTTVNNVTNNNTSNVDFEAGTNNFLNKVKG
jgi:TP901 family phage tail tape measure protein